MTEEKHKHDYKYQGKKRYNGSLKNYYVCACGADMFS